MKLLASCYDFNSQSHDKSMTTILIGDPKTRYAESAQPRFRSKCARPYPVGGVWARDYLVVDPKLYRVGLIFFLDEVLT